MEIEFIELKDNFMEMDIIAVGNIFIDLESGQKCRVREIMYSPKENCTTVVFRFDNETEIKITGDKIAEQFAKVSSF